MGFLREWLGETSLNKSFNLAFSRDVGAAARFLNDRAYFNHVTYPVSKYGLSYMASSLAVKNDMKGDCLHDSIMGLEVYRRLVGYKV